MSTITMSLPVAPIADSAAPNCGSPGGGGVVEINLLLPEEWASNLIELSRQRHQSVGQIIRSMIGQALHEDSRQK